MTRRGRTIVVVTAVAAALLFAVLTRNVLDHEALVRYDRYAVTVVADHRVAWLTAGMQVVTWLGSNAVLLPLLVVVSVVMLWRRRAVRATLSMWTAYGAAVLCYTTTKRLVDRTRPPAHDAVMHVTGAAFPSGHATQAVAAWGGLAIALITVLPGHRFTVLACAVAIVLLVGLSRVYLGVHWPTDVVAGYALGSLCLMTVLALHPARAAPHPTGAVDQ